MKSNKEWAKIENVDMDFDIWIYNIAKKRYVEGKDKKILSFRIITRALRNISLIPKIEEILLSAEIKDDRWHNEK